MDANPSWSWFMVRIGVGELLRWTSYTLGMPLLVGAAEGFHENQTAFTPSDQKAMTQCAVTPLTHWRSCSWICEISSYPPLAVIPAPQMDLACRGVSVLLGGDAQMERRQENPLLSREMLVFTWMENNEIVEACRKILELRRGTTWWMLSDLQTFWFSFHLKISHNKSVSSLWILLAWRMMFQSQTSTSLCWEVGFNLWAFKKIYILRRHWAVLLQFKEKIQEDLSSSPLETFLVRRKQHLSNDISYSDIFRQKIFLFTIFNVSFSFIKMSI